ncbi:MAG: glucose-6-phosphate dehydrogenase [bacterium]
MNAPAKAPARFCLEVAPAPCVLVFFGATGDLARRKLVPSLCQLEARGLLHACSRIVGCGRTPHDDASFRALIAEALPDGTSAAHDAFLSRLSYVRTDDQDPASFTRLAAHLDTFDTLDTPVPFNRMYYLATPPGSCQPLVTRLADAGLFAEAPGNGAWRHLALEKPFGTDTASAAALDAFLHGKLREEQVFRVDHYLAKDTVQNILMLRFANILFEPVWNAHHIDHVQITVAEIVGIENRAGYFEQTGLLRDMFQNHLLEMLALVAMEPPATFSADAIHAEKKKLIQAIRPFSADACDLCVVRGQYAAGNGLPGYLDEPGVRPGSSTETFVAARLFIDNWRWRGVPFYLRAGKRLAVRESEIVLAFKPVPHSMFSPASPNALTPNTLALRVQPQENVNLLLQAKLPGPKLCIGDLPLHFAYADLGAWDAPDAYARLLLDVMLDDHTLFVRSDTIAASWQLFTPVLDAWRDAPAACPVHAYPAGSEGPAAAADLIVRDGRAWRTLA